MNAKTIGLVIVVIGLIMTLYTGFTYVTREKIVDIGNVEISTDKDHTATWSPFIGIGIMVIGGVVFLYGKKSNSD
jgi:LPXTG-motif cell wall-anchored protein